MTVTSWMKRLRMSVIGPLGSGRKKISSIDKIKMYRISISSANPMKSMKKTGRMVPWIKESIQRTLFSSLVQSPFRLSCSTTKPTKCHERQAKASDQPGNPAYLISLRCPQEEAFGPWLSLERTSQTLVRSETGHFVSFVVLRLIYFLFSSDQTSTS